METFTPPQLTERERLILSGFKSKRKRKTKKRRELTASQVYVYGLICDLFDQGMKPINIAEHLGLSRGYTSNILIRYNRRTYKKKAQQVKPKRKYTKRKKGFFARLAKAFR